MIVATIADAQPGEKCSIFVQRLEENHAISKSDARQRFIGFQ